jgi:hypothetical protein
MTARSGWTEGRIWTIAIGLAVSATVAITGIPPTLDHDEKPASPSRAAASHETVGGTASNPTATTDVGPAFPRPSTVAGRAAVKRAPSPAAVARRLPSGVPAAALEPEPTLPVPAGWPFPESFPRTSGTGRLDGGAFFWSDFLYDDHGAVGQGAKWYQGQGRVTGTYSYPPGPSQPPGNGIGGDNAADIFRVAVGLDKGASYWRIDWNTLVDPAHPAAAFGLDTDADPETGTDPWPGVSGLHSPGVDRTLFVSSRGAWLLDGEHRRPVATPGDGLMVDARARSFVVRLPDNVLDANRTWRVRVVSGVADATGQGFLPIGPDLGATPGQPPIYNVSFRRSDQEMVRLREFNGAKVRGLYTDKAQADALTNGDVSTFFADVRWGDLEARATTPEPIVKGPSNRWYRSSVELGAGVVNTYQGFSDGKPNLLGRVQPYTVWVPDSYDGSRPAPLTLLVHPNGSTHNEYIDSPKLMQIACEDARSICVTFAGRSPDETPSGVMELDFWEVWNRVATEFNVDAERTRLFAFSQGGGVANHLVMTYPDLFARAAVFSPGCCGDTNMVENLRWVPMFVADNSADPTLADAVPEANRLDALGYRHRFELYPEQDHVSFGFKDHYSRGARYLGDGSITRTRRPGHVTYVWSHEHDHPEYGFGVQGAYWVRSPAARDRSLEARIDAVSEASPDRSVTVRRTDSQPTDDPTPATAHELTWLPGSLPASVPRIELRLTNVGELTLELAEAGLPAGANGTIDIIGDGSVRVRLTQLAPRTRVTVDGTGGGTVPADGTITLVVPSGEHTIRLGGSR